MGNDIFQMIEPLRLAKEPSASGCSPNSVRSTQSRALRVQVIRSGQTKAELTFPVAAAENLCDLIPPEVESKLSARGIDLAQLSNSLKENGYSPGELFSLSAGGDNFRVWLE
jgi:hypothetical protein